MNFLKHLGSFFKTVLHIGEEVAAIAAPFVGIAIPQISGIFNTTLQTVIAGEGIFTNAQKNISGSGPEKAAAALPTLLPLFQNWAKVNGINADDPKVKAATQAAIDATVNFLKSFNEITSSTNPVVPASQAVIDVKAVQS